MAERLLASDVTLHVFDPRSEVMGPFAARGAVACTSSGEVATKAEIIFACLPNAKVSEAVAAEVAAAGALRIYAKISTIGRQAVERIATFLAPRGTACVDAPISGGPDGARAGTLAMMAADEPDAVAALRPWQERIGLQVFVLGDKPGQAQVMKLVNNLLFAVSLTSACEGFAMSAKAGLDPDAMPAMVNVGKGRSLITERVIEAVLSGRFRDGASLTVMDRDAQPGIAEARVLSAPIVPTASSGVAGRQHGPMYLGERPASSAAWRRHGAGHENLRDLGERGRAHSARRVDVGRDRCGTPARILSLGHVGLRGEGWLACERAWVAEPYPLAFAAASAACVRAETARASSSALRR